LEGFDGVGKSTIGRQVAARLDATFLDSDDFATAFDDPPRYVDCLRLDELRDDIRKGLSAGPVVLAAVCSREIWPSESVSVYLKRLSFTLPEMPLWHRELDFEDPPPSREPHKSIFNYHLRYRPHEIADLIVEMPDIGQTMNGTIF
jgi:hypothetical protein